MVPGHYDACNSIQCPSFAKSLLECMTFIVARTVETVIGMAEVSDTLAFQPLPSNVVIFAMPKSMLQEWRCF